MKRANIPKKTAFEYVKEVDAFPKVPDSFQETTVSGGGVTILAFLLVIVMVVSEFNFYSSTHLKFSYDADGDHHAKMKINIDMTIAMKCAAIGADVLDMVGQAFRVHGSLNEEPTYFDLTASQKSFFEVAQASNEHIRKEYHSLHKLFWKSGYYGRLLDFMPSRNDKDRKDPYNACRLTGSLTVDKVAGNFHVTAGKSIPVFPRGHVHLSTGSDKEYNFSHRINYISFGDDSQAIVNPLDGEQKITEQRYTMFQYFIQVVPTRIHTTYSTINTYQFAVTEQNRSISHSEGSHGVPGIFFKYDISALKVTVLEQHRPYWQFLVRLCGIIGGVYATSGLLHILINSVVNLICCRFGFGKYTLLPRKIQTENQSSGDSPTFQPTPMNSGNLNHPVTPEGQPRNLGAQPLLSNHDPLINPGIQPLASAALSIPDAAVSLLPQNSNIPS